MIQLALLLVRHENCKSQKMDADAHEKEEKLPMWRGIMSFCDHDRNAAEARQETEPGD